MTAEVRAVAPAKINLCLGVGGVREDGFHPLATVYQAVGLYDEVTARPADEDSVTVSGDGVDVSQVPTDASNLALRAVHALAEHHGRSDLTVSLHLHKSIPVAGGLAGGSADAAAALVAADALFGLGTPRADLLELAAGLGSDVPFCLVGGTAMGSGRGEIVTPVLSRGEYWWVLVPDGAGLSTPQVYAEFDRVHAGVHVPDPVVPDALAAALREGSADALGAALFNDLQGPALSFRPDLADRLEEGREAGACGGLVSGSGPTTVFLCRSRVHADEVAGVLRAHLQVPLALVVRAPAQGARLSGGRR